jgi:NAD(P)-dependent dehydrogenase (short-subunit alcohol dehydrogenase family)
VPEAARFAGTRVLVTGAAAAQGIGAATARWFAARGALLLLNDRVPSDNLDALARELGGQSVPADITDRAAVTALVEKAEAGGGIDVLVANAAYMSMAPLVEADPQNWWRVLDVNLLGTFTTIQTVVPGMLTRGSGRIVVVASEWGLTGWPEATAYAASKAGLVALVKSLGRELAPRGVLVNGVAPGVTDTPQLDVDAAAAGLSGEEMRGHYAAQTPLRRIGDPADIAATIGMLADPRLGSLVGQIVSSNGGTTRGRA